MVWSSCIQSTGSYLPERILSNDDLSKMMDTSDEWIRERSGIEQRRIASPDETAATMGTAAAQTALERAGWQANDVDLIIAATLSPDYYFPGIGIQIQDALGCRPIPAIDVRGQCAGFTWALATADAYMRTGNYRKALVIGSEVHSRVLQYNTEFRNTAILFGDAGAAVTLEAIESSEAPSAHNEVRGVIDNLMGTDGSGLKSLWMERPGMTEAQFILPEDIERKSWVPQMEGRQVFKNAVQRMTECATKVLQRNNLTPDQIDLVVPHQANLRINEMIRQRLELPPERFVNNIQKLGNTTSATIPLGFEHAVADGRLKPGSLILTVAFGSGFAWGGNLLRW